MPEVLQSLWRFLRRVLSDLPSSIGSNHLGVWFPVIPTCLWFLYQWSQQGWQSMKHDLVVGIAITAISYALLFLYCVVRNLYREHLAIVAKEKKTRAELEYIRNIPRWTGYESEEAWRSAIDEQNRLVNLGHSIDGFSVLLLDTIRLHQDLMGYLKEIGPEPTCDTSRCNNDPELNVLALTKWTREIIPFRTKLRSEYSLKFQNRATELYHRFTVIGVSDHHFASVVDSATSIEDIQELARVIWEAARKAG
jgi:hypothetical protein